MSSIYHCNCWLFFSIDQIQIIITPCCCILIVVVSWLSYPHSCCIIIVISLLLLNHYLPCRILVIPCCLLIIVVVVYNICPPYIICNRWLLFPLTVSFSPLSLDVIHPHTPLLQCEGILPKIRWKDVVVTASLNLLSSLDIVVIVVVKLPYVK